MSKQLGQWDFYEALPEVDWSTSASFDVPAFEAPPIDYADYYGTWNYDFGTTEDFMLGQEVFDTPGLTPISDASGNVYYYDPGGYVDYVEDPTGTPIPTEQTVEYGELQASYPTPEAAASDFSLQFPDVDWPKLLAAGVDIYKTYTQMEMAERAGAPRPPTATPTTRTNPTTGQREYYNPATRTWQSTPPTPGTVPTTTAQIIPGIPNTTLLIGAGVIALAFMLRR